MWVPSACICNKKFLMRISCYNKNKFVPPLFVSRVNITHIKYVKNKYPTIVEGGDTTALRQHLSLRQVWPTYLKQKMIIIFFALFQKINFCEAFEDK